MTSEVVTPRRSLNPSPPWAPRKPRHQDDDRRQDGRQRDLDTHQHSGQAERLLGDGGDAQNGGQDGGQAGQNGSVNGSGSRSRRCLYPETPRSRDSSSVADTFPLV